MQSGRYGRVGMKRSIQAVLAGLALTMMAVGVLADRPHQVPRSYDRSHYYPPRGRTFDHAPHGAIVVPHHTSPYYYHGGVWYRPSGSHFVVVTPPIGLVVPMLPPFYSTLWIGGYPYYYANGVYYAWRAQERGYEVTAPPKQSDVTMEAPALELFVYPRNGQTEAQQGTDRYECHTWAVGQTGFDPVTPQGGVDASQWATKREDYQRALGACLEARGYSVK